MLMGNSVEGRFPFLDANLAEFARRLPAEHKMRGMDEKHLLKRAFADLVPEEILRRPKQPYRAPDSASFFSSAPPAWIDDVTSPTAVADAGIFQPVIVEKLLEKCRRNGGRGVSNTDNMRLVAVLSTQLLDRLFLSGNTHSFSQAAPPAPMAVFDHVQDQSGTTVSS
jgi:asparagine synthase (glutamine-hydrolysing)